MIMNFIYSIFLMIILIEKPFGNCVTYRLVTYPELNAWLRRITTTNMTTTEIPYDPTPDILESFTKSIKRRLDLEVDLARYKWKHNLEVTIQKELHDDVLEHAETQAKNLSIPPGDAAQFVSDLIEAGSIMQYALISDWHANETLRDKWLFDVSEINITDVYSKMRQYENDILETMATLNEFRLKDSCNKDVSSFVFHVIRHDKYTFKRIALQMTVCNFCKISIPHEYPFKGYGIKTKRTTFKWRVYKRKTKVYTTPKPTISTSPLYEVESFPSSYYESDGSLSSRKTVPFSSSGSAVLESPSELY